MSDHRLPCGGIISLADIYTYGGFTFQWHSYCGPMKCRLSDGDPHRGREGEKFYAAAQAWRDLPPEERERYRWRPPARD